MEEEAVLDIHLDRSLGSMLRLAVGHNLARGVYLYWATRVLDSHILETPAEEVPGLELLELLAVGLAFLLRR